MNPEIVALIAPKPFDIWRNAIDAQMGADWRRDMAWLYSWHEAFDQGLSPQEAVTDCREWLL